MHCVRISDSDSGGFLTFDLADVLQCLAPTASAMTWHVEWYKARWRPGDADRLRMLQRQLHDAKQRPIQWDILVDAAGHIFQTENAKLVGELPSDNTRRVQIEAVDTSYWTVETDDAALVQAVHARFAKVESCTD